MKFLFLEPFFGGSHREFAEGLIACSRHRIDLVTLPARFWKWRMRGAALHFVNKCGSSLRDYDGLITTGLMSLADFKALAFPDCPPALVYFHESQLTYPLAPGEEMDYQFGFTDATTALSADRILFNSRAHRDAFFEALPRFLKMMPDHRPNWVPDAIAPKTGVFHPGCRFAADGNLPRERLSTQTPPLVVWNHRWEFDKDPDAFFEAVDRVLSLGSDLRLALLGESARKVPKAFISARRRLADRIVRYGYVESRKEYLKWLQCGTIAVSTALQENFGIATVEAIRCGCLPLLPNRLSYPEIIPAEHHDAVLYGNREDLVEKLVRRLNQPSRYRELRRALSEEMARFAWAKRIESFDGELESLARQRRRRG